MKNGHKSTHHPVKKPDDIVNRSGKSFYGNRFLDDDVNAMRQVMETDPDNWTVHDLKAALPSDHSLSDIVSWCMLNVDMNVLKRHMGDSAAMATTTKASESSESKKPAGKSALEKPAGDGDKPKREHKGAGPWSDEELATLRRFALVIPRRSPLWKQLLPDKSAAAVRKRVTAEGIERLEYETEPLPTADEVAFVLENRRRFGSDVIAWTKRLERPMSMRMIGRIAELGENHDVEGVLDTLKSERVQDGLREVAETGPFEYGRLEDELRNEGHANGHKPERTSVPANGIDSEDACPSIGKAISFGFGSSAAGPRGNDPILLFVISPDGTEACVHTTVFGLMLLLVRHSNFVEADPEPDESGHVRLDIVIDNWHLAAVCSNTGTEYASGDVLPWLDTHVSVWFGQLTARIGIYSAISGEWKKKNDDWYHRGNDHSGK